MLSHSRAKRTTTIAITIVGRAIKKKAKKTYTKNETKG